MFAFLLYSCLYSCCRYTFEEDLLSYDEDLGVSTMGTLLEAQFAMLPIFHEKRSYYDNVDQAWCLAEKVAFLLCEAQDQDKPAHMLGGLPHNLKVKNEVDYKKKANMMENNIVRTIKGSDGFYQIDDTQHVLSAWLSYKEALESGLSEIDCSQVDLSPLIDSLFDGMERKRH